jgi:hypothetical protein
MIRHVVVWTLKDPADVALVCTSVGAAAPGAHQNHPLESP